MTRKEANKLPDGRYMVRAYGVRASETIAKKEGRLWIYDGYHCEDLPAWVFEIDPNPITQEIKFEPLN